MSMETHRFMLVISLCLVFSRINANVIEKRDVPSEQEQDPIPSIEIIREEDEREELFCNAPPNVECGYYNGSDYRMGSIITLHCNQGCKLIGSPEIRCLPVPDPFKHVVIWDTFSGRLPTCQRAAKRSAKFFPLYNEYKSTKSDPEEQEILMLPTPPPQLKPGPSIDSMPGVGLNAEKEKDILCHQNKKKCHQPLKKGRCKAAFKRFYFNSTLDKCVPFTYGGCQGNGNNFGTLRECQDACMC